MQAITRHTGIGTVHILLGALIVSMMAAAAVAEITKVTVFKAGEDGYSFYRIPVIIRAANGDLLAFAEGRKNDREDHGDIDLVLKRSTDNGKSWGALQLVQDE